MVPNLPVLPKKLEMGLGVGARRAQHTRVTGARRPSHTLQKARPRCSSTSNTSTRTRTFTCVHGQIAATSSRPKPIWTRTSSDTRKLPHRAGTAARSSAPRRMHAATRDYTTTSTCASGAQRRMNMETRSRCIGTPTKAPGAGTPRQCTRINM